MGSWRTLMISLIKFLILLQNVSWNCIWKKRSYLILTVLMCYWKTNQSRFHELSQMARDVLTIPLSTIASESAFSVGGRVLNAYHSSFQPETMETVICLRDWVFDKAPLVAEVNVDDLCGDMMNPNVNGDDYKSEVTSKYSSDRSGIGFGESV